MDLTRVRLAAHRRCNHLAQEIVDEIAHNPHTPFDVEDHDPGTKHLRNSYYVDEAQELGGAVVKTTAAYWRFVEFGTGHGPAQPHVRPAIEVVRARHR